MLIQLRPEALGQDIEERLFVAEALINCWGGAAGFACYGTQRQAMFAARAPEPLRRLQDAFFQQLVRVWRHVSIVLAVRCVLSLKLQRKSNTTNTRRGPSTIRHKCA